MATLSDASGRYLKYLGRKSYSKAHLATVRSRLKMFVEPPASRQGGEIKLRGDRAVDSIGRAEMGRYFAELKELYPEGTLAGHASTHKAFWGWCKKKKLITKNPTKNLESYSFKPVVREAAPLGDVLIVAGRLFEFARHRDNHPADIRDALFVSICIDSAARRGAVLKLRWKDITDALAHPRQAANGRVVYRLYVLRDKTGSKRPRMFSESAELFEMWSKVAPGHSETDAVFLSLVTGKRMHADRASQAFVRICEWVGVPVFRSQALRKLNVSDIVSMTNIDVGQRYAEHSDPATTMTHYLTKKAEQVDDAAAELAERRRGSAAINEDMARFFGLLEDE